MSHIDQPFSLLQLDDLTTPAADDLLLVTESSVNLRCSDGVISAPSLSRLTSPAGLFVAGDSGKSVVIAGAAADGSPHVAKARWINANTLALVPSAGQAVSAADVTFPISKSLKWSTVTAAIAAGGSQGIVGTFATGEEIAGSSLIHLAGGLAFKADASLDRPAHGFALAGAALGAEITVTSSGLLAGLGGLLPNAALWLGLTGLVTHTLPTSPRFSQRVGLAQTASTAFISIDPLTTLIS